MVRPKTARKEFETFQIPMGQHKRFTHFFPVAYEAFRLPAFGREELKRPHKTSVIDALEYDGFLAEALDTLHSAFNEWNSIEGRGNHQLWNMLGTVYELGAKVNANGAAMDDLIRRVKSVDDVKDNNHWDPEKKTPDELLLTLLLGLKPETKATKSQWLGAVKAARKAKIKPDRDECSAWFKSVGGLQAARKAVRTDGQSRTFEDWLTEIDGYGDEIDPEYPSFRVPNPTNGGSFISGLGMVLVRQLDDGNVVPLTTVANKGIITQAIKAFLAEQRRLRAQSERVWKEEKAAERKRLMPKWKEWQKNFPGDFDQFEDWLEYGAEEITSHPAAQEARQIQAKFVNQARRKSGLPPIKPYK